MNAANYLKEDELLKIFNYEYWYPIIRSILKGKGLLKYIEKDIISKVTKEVRTGTKNDKDLKKVEMEDSKVMTFLLTSISAEVKEKIKDTKTSYEIMTKIKELYKDYKNDVVQYHFKRNATLDHINDMENMSRDAPFTFPNDDTTTSKHKNEWLEAIENEWNDLYDPNLAFKLPINEKPNNTKWVFTTNHDNHNNKFKTFKERMADKGYGQIRRAEYELSFFPTLNVGSIIFIASLAVGFRTETFRLEQDDHQINAKKDKDISIAFQQVQLDLDIEAY